MSRHNHGRAHHFVGRLLQEGIHEICAANHLKSDWMMA
jgi:hypothetical protein